MSGLTRLAVVIAVVLRFAASAAAETTCFRASGERRALSERRARVRSAI